MGKWGMDRESKRILITAPATISVLVIITLVSVYLSPINSWDPSYRDSDGTPDARDAFPEDPSRSVPTVVMEVSGQNHQWNVYLMRTMDHTGEEAPPIPLEKVNLRILTLYYGYAFSMPLDNMPQGQTVLGVKYIPNAVGVRILSPGDLFVLDAEIYDPGCRLILEDPKTNEQYCSYSLYSGPSWISGTRDWTDKSFNWTFTVVQSPILWSDILITLWDLNHTIAWDPRELGTGANRFPEVWAGDIGYNCSLHTSNAHGYIVSGDNISITAEPSFEPGRGYEASIHYCFDDVPIMESCYTADIDCELSVASIASGEK